MCFEDLDAKARNIESKNNCLKGFGRFWMKRVYTGTTTYFTYYLYGFKGSFEAALKSFKKTLCWG